MISLEQHRKALLLWGVGCAQFILVMVIVQSAYGCSNYGGCYDIGTSAISNLGSAGYHGTPPNVTVNGVTTPWPTSPLWPLFNISIVLMGSLLLVGCFLVSSTPFFPKGRLTQISLFLFGLAGIGGAGVGVWPEDTIYALHIAAADVAFLGIALAVLVMALALYRAKGWDRRWFYGTLAAALLSMVGVLLLFAPALGLVHSWAYWGPGLGFGGCERIVIVGPFAWVFAVSYRGLFGKGKR